MQNLLGALFLLIFIGTPVAIGAFIALKYGPAWAQKKRDREIETAMRLGMRDAEAQQRIAEQIMRERRR